MRLLISAALIFVAATAHAAPSITTASTGLVHGGTLTVSGSSFGSKSPASPLMWDNGEHANTLAAQGWDAVDPDTLGDEYDTAYRSGTYRGVTNPHSRGTRYIAGGHKDVRPYSGSDNVAVMVSNGGLMTNIYARYYHRFDPAWPTGGATDGSNVMTGNHKYFNMEPQPATMVYGTPTHYIDFNHGTSCPSLPEHDACTTASFNATGNPTIDVSALKAWQQWEIRTTAGGALYGTAGATAIFNGQAWPWGTSEIGGVTVGGYLCYQDDIYTIPTASWTGPDGNGEWTAIFPGDNTAYALLRNDTTLLNGTIGALTADEWAYSAGTVYIGFDPTGNTIEVSHSCCGSCSEINNLEHGGHNDAFRYFDDIYIDSTWSRVMLCNNQTYASATICEPQIPSTWADGSITATINLGALPDSGVAYLFVFDSANAVSDGYLVTLGSLPAGPVSTGGIRFDGTIRLNGAIRVQ